MTTTDHDMCAIRWCEEVFQHSGVHRRYLGDLMFPRRPDIATISFTLEARDRCTKPQLVLTIPTSSPPSYTSIVFAWPQVEYLETILIEAMARSRTQDAETATAAAQTLDN